MKLKNAIFSYQVKDRTYNVAFIKRDELFHYRVLIRLMKVENDQTAELGPVYDAEHTRIVRIAPGTAEYILKGFLSGRIKQED